MRRQFFCWVCALLLGARVAAAQESAFNASGIPLPTSSSMVSWDLNEPLNSARMSFLDLDVGAAAAKIRQGAHALRTEAHDASSDIKPSLVESADHLDTLAQRVESRQVQRAEELDRPFARALHVAALNHHSKGEQHLRQGEAKQAGHRLKAAADHLESAATATGHRIDAATHEAIRESRAASTKLAQGAGHATDEVGKTFKTLRHEAGKVGEKLVHPVALRQPAPAELK